MNHSLASTSRLLGGVPVVVLASGGLDSTTMLWWLTSIGADIHPLFVDYGQHCARTERACLQNVLSSLSTRLLVEHDVSSVYRNSPSRLVVEADLFNERVEADDLHLPYRNSLLVNCAAAHAETLDVSYVAAAFINTNIALEADCRHDFFDAINLGLRQAGPVQLVVPFSDMSKRDVVNLAVTLGAPVGATFSCQVASSVPCGACPNCYERSHAILPEPASEDDP
jgi:7-cyano-7-deazaguanine synthase